MKHKNYDQETYEENFEKNELDTIKSDEEFQVFIKPTPLPKKEMFVIMCIVVAEGFASSMILPFIAFMVIDFGINEEQVGYYAGLITSTFFWCSTNKQFLLGIYFRY